MSLTYLAKKLRAAERLYWDGEAAIGHVGRD